MLQQDKEKLKKISRSLDGSGKAVFLDKNLKELKSVSQKSISSSLRRIMGTAIIVIDGSATPAIINSSEESGVQAVVAKNFQTTDTKIKLMSL